MKKQFSLVCLSFLLLLQSCNTKKESDPQPAKFSSPSKDAHVSGFSWTGATVTGTWLASSFADQNTGFITGLSGAMVKTTDGGATFTPISGLPAQNLYACYFKTTLEGFIAGDNNTALHTTDGGVTWTPLSLPALPTVHFRHIYFYDAQTGFITGGAGTVLKTKDGGTTWLLSNSGIASSYAIYSMVFFDPNEGLAGSSSGGVYKTINGGKSWTLTTVHDSRSTISGMSLIHLAPGIDSVYVSTSIGNSISTDQTTILMTGDRGFSWIKKTIPGPYQVLAGIKITPGAIYAVGGSVANNTGVIYSNTGGYTTWTQEAIPASGRFTTMALVNYSPGNAVLFAAGLNNTVVKGQ